MMYCEIRDTHNTMWPSQLTQNSHRYGGAIGLRSVERYAPIIRFVRLATTHATESAVLLAPPAFPPLPTVDGVITQTGDVVLIVGADDGIGQFVTVGADGGPQVDLVPVRTIVMVLEGAVYHRALFVRGDAPITMQVSGAVYSEAAGGGDNTDTTGTSGESVSLISSNNMVRRVVSHDCSVALRADATGAMVDLATAVHADAIVPTVDNTWTLQYEQTTGNLVVHLRMSGVDRAVSLTDSGSQGVVVVPFGWNDVEWTIGQFLVDKDINGCRLIADDAGSYVPSLQFTIPDTTGPHVGEALLMVRGCPLSLQQSGFSLSFTLQLYNDTPMSFWVGIDCLDASGEMHHEIWQDPNALPLPSHSHYSGALTIPSGGGLRSVCVTDWQANDYAGPPMPTVTAVDHLVYPKFSAPTNCQVIVLRMGISDPSNVKLHILSGQVEFMKPLLL